MALDAKQISKLQDAYFNLDNPSAFSSVKQVAAKAGVKQTDAVRWMQEQDVYTLHKNYRKKFPRRVVHAPAPLHTVHADLADMQALAKHNLGYRYFLILVDCHSKRFWAEPVKSKTAPDMEAAFDKIFSLNNGWWPTAIVSDRGMEFWATRMKKYFADRNINHYSTKSEIKASLAERGIRTVKTRLFKALTHANTFKWIDILPKIIHGINHSVNRTLGRTPASIQPNEILQDRRVIMSASKTSKFAVGDTVRLLKYRQVFDKSYLPNFTQELFVVSAVKSSHKPVYYLLKDLNGQPIEGSFYDEELVKSVNREQVYKVEAVLKTRKFRGKKQHFVKWLGYDDSFNSWVDASDVHDL